MILHTVWVTLVLGACVLGLVQCVSGDVQILDRMLTGLFESARSGFEISIGLVGVMCFWLGIMKIGERSGMISLFARAIAPLLRRLMPEIPAGHAAAGSIAMNVGANMLGLDNAATPLGLKAMRELQTLNTQPGTASNAMIMFLVLNTAGLTLIPTSVIAIRQTLAIEQGLTGSNPADIFLPTLIATFVSWSTGLLVVARVQRIPLLQIPIAALLGGFGLLMALVCLLLRNLPTAQSQALTGLVGSGIIISLIALFVVVGSARRIDVYQAFVEGAKDGFTVAIGIVPYLVAMLAAISLFRSSGGMSALTDALSALVAALNLDPRFVPALPVGLMKILSGSGARGLMIDVMQTYGVDSFQGRLAAIMQGSSETTFYVLAVYFGSVDILKTRHALACALTADLAGLIAAITVGYAFYG